MFMSVDISFRAYTSSAPNYIRSLTHCFLLMIASWFFHYMGHPCPLVTHPVLLARVGPEGSTEEANFATTYTHTHILFGGAVVYRNCGPDRGLGRAFSFLSFLFPPSSASK